MFVILVHYTKRWEEVEPDVEDHKTYLERFYASGHLLFSGPQTTRTGGVILGRFDSEDEAWEMVKGDPFYTRGLAKYDVISFRATKAAPEFRELLG
ncbi:YciI family protein [Kyrpidia tusciae]|uniref:YCII-related protein n=1 Tax=Kyrpidia tusciae (strain DSM 2912 / NBRC 15312 / T2) TaxID=562970 RepID=D5WUB6_KYRT2|nr:YciI family protein [Kyrpidia tusciae]ADG07368.1 YCII-related protein [Kyrpidia tusciae DSM 2912]